MARHRSVIFPWILVVLWICVIWGHSLLSGDDSSTESLWLMNYVRGFGAWLYTSDIPWIQSFLAAHPGILDLFADSERLHYVIRKTAHFTEYFVLGILVLNAAYRTLRSLVSAVFTICMLWTLVPGIDETIQRFVPGRAGMLSDVMIDMGGFGTAVAMGLPVVGILAAFGRLRHPSR